jgi:hypothetical protein
MQVDLESARVSKMTSNCNAGACSHLPVFCIVVKQIFVVGLLGWIGGEETAAIGIPAPDSGPVGTEQLLQLGI